MNNYTMHVVSHTHWDREWYRPFQQFRMRLVELIDHLIGLMEADPEYKFFHLDGQTIVLDDYLQIRPENEARLRKLVSEGRILIGPWYNQPDEFLVSGEAMIRNLALGRKMGDDWGNWMRVGYVPDCFGHISQFPQIMRGFGIDNAVLFRGITADQVKSEFTWRSPDGSEVLCVKMPDDNAYSNFYYRLRDVLALADSLPTSDEWLEKAREEIKGLVEDCVNEMPTTDNLLLMDGVDHIFANQLVPAIIQDANENLPFGKMIHSTLPDFVEAVKAAKPELQTFEGELRISNRKWKLQSVLAGVMSSRIHLKQANHEIQTLLEKWAEPFSAIAWRLGKEYPSSYLSLAWKYLLQNHPHDSICGCSVDQVHKDMVYRFDQARLIAQPVVQKALTFIAEQVSTNTEHPTPNTLGLVVFNPLSWERSEVVEAEVNFPNDWPAQGLMVTDSDGNEVPFQVLEARGGSTFDQAPHDIPVGKPTQYRKIAFLAEGVPSVGYKTFFVKALDHAYRTPGTMVRSYSGIQNERVNVDTHENGRIALWGQDEYDSVSFDGLIFEDGGDFGDGWNYRKPARDTVVLSTINPSQISIVEECPVLTTMRIDTSMTVPAAMNPNGLERSAETVEMKIASYITLRKNSSRVDIVTEVDNTARDHRLRVLFPTQLEEARISNSESLFDVVARPVQTPECRDWKEPMPVTHPQKSFVDLSNGEYGISVINEGLPEFEVLDDTNRTVALTLMRSFIGGVGGRESLEQGEIPGKHVFRYAVYPHKGDWEQAQVWREAWGHNAPMRAVQTGIHEGELPLAKSFVSIESPSVVLSALKKADRADRIVARVFNIGTTEASGAVAVDGAGKLSAADLNEEVQGEAPSTIGPKRILTLIAEI